MFTKHLNTIRQKAMGAFLKLFPLLSRDSPFILQHKLMLYNLVLRAMITYALWSPTPPQYGALLHQQTSTTSKSSSL